MIKLELNKEEVEALKYMLKVEIESYKSDETETSEFNTLIQLKKKVSNAKRKADGEVISLDAYRRPFAFRMPNGELNFIEGRYRHVAVLDPWE